MQCNCVVVAPAREPCSDASGCSLFGSFSCRVAGIRFWVAQGPEIVRLQVFARGSHKSFQGGVKLVKPGEKPGKREAGRARDRQHTDCAFCKGNDDCAVYHRKGVADAGIRSFEVSLHIACGTF